MRKIHRQNDVEKLMSDPFIKNSILSISLDQQFEML